MSINIAKRIHILPGSVCFSVQLWCVYLYVRFLCVTSVPFCLCSFKIIWLVCLCCSAMVGSSNQSSFLSTMVVTYLAL